MSGKGFLLLIWVKFEPIMLQIGTRLPYNAQFRLYIELGKDRAYYAANQYPSHVQRRFCQGVGPHF